MWALASYLGARQSFQFIECSGSSASYVQALTGNHVGPTTAAALLEEMFSSGGRAGTSKRVTVLLVDEMDLLVTKKQTVTTWKA